MSAVSRARRGSTATAAMLLLASTATAQITPTPDDGAEDAVRRAVELRRVGRDVEALAVFRRAYESHPTARLRVQVGLAEEAAGLWADAERDLLGAASDPDDGWAARNATAVADALRQVRDHLASVDIRTDADSVEVWVDGTMIGKTPLGKPTRVIAGKVTIELRAPGYKSSVQIISLPPGAEFEETANLLAVGGTSAADAPSAMAPPVNATLASAATVAPVYPPDSGKWESRTVGWFLVATGGALLAGGLVAQGVTDANASVYDDDTRCLVGGLTRDQRCGSSRDRAEAAQAVAVAGFSLGALAGVAGAIALITSHRTPPRVGAASLACAPGLSWLSCRGQF